MEAIVDVVHTTVFGCIAVSEELIGCNNLVDYKSFADYASLMIQKITIEAMIVLVIGGVATLDKFKLVMPLVH